MVFFLLTVSDSKCSTKKKSLLDTTSVKDFKKLLKPRTVFYFLNARRK